MMKPIPVKKIKLTDESMYSVAPYNFVSFPEISISRYNRPEELPPHNSYKGNELLSGYIEYTLRAKTPIIVSDGVKKNEAYFFKNSDGEYAIPGNSIRGMVRTNAQILSFSNIVGNKDEKNKYGSSYVEDSRFLYRDMAGGNSLSKRYNRILSIDPNKRIAKDLKAGYIHKENRKYYIQPAMEIKEGIPYFRVDEIELRKIGGNRIKGIEFLYDEGLKDYEQELRKLNKIARDKAKSWMEKSKAAKEIQRILKDHSRENKGFKPYQVRISFDLNEKGKVIKVGNAGECNYEGYILSGGFILGKRSHYIIPMEDDNQHRINLSEDDIMAYEDDMVSTKKADKKSGIVVPREGYEYYALPKEGETKPIFYINKNGHHFGFTPYLRLSYTKSVLDGVPEGYKNNSGISYADSIFGFSNKVYKVGKNLKKFSYKSRVSFSDAVVIGKAEEDNESIIDIVLAQPKPTSYNLYLKQDDTDKKNLKTYEDDDFNIRGYKEYWLKNYIENPEIEKDKLVNMKKKIHPLKEGTEFKGRIYFTNLYEDELGLLGWSLKLNDGCYQNIGLAKPYGFGRIEVVDVRVKIEDLQKKYTSFSFDYYKDDDINKYISLYKEFFSKNKLKGKNIEETTPVKELMYIKSVVIEEDERNNYRYMDLDEFKLKKVLPTIIQCKNGAYSKSHNKDRASKAPNNERKEVTNKKVKKNSINAFNKSYKNSFGNAAKIEAFNKALKGK